jgi:putative addiction module component (TIGR02574 family)
VNAEADQAPLTEAQREELLRRVTAYEANPKASFSWQQVRARLQAR